MAATPAQIRTGIVNALTSAFGATGVQISGYRLDSPQDLCLQILGTDSVEYDQAMQRGVDYWTFQLQALAGSPIDKQAQTQLDVWKQPATGGVKAAIESDVTLGGIVAGVRVTKASGDQIYTSPNRVEGVLGCVFDVFVVNTGH